MENEVATYKQTTFDNVVKNLETFEQSQSQTQQPNETSETSVNQDGHLQPEAHVQPEATQVAGGAVETTGEQATQEENVSNFDLGGGAAPNEAQATVQVQDAATYNWKDELKKLDVKEVAKELGLSDFALEMNEYMAKGGKATDYITAKGYDWTKVADEDLVKEELRSQYPDAPELQITRLYNKKYNQREDDMDEDREDGLLLMRAEARRLREEKITKQNSFKIPDAAILPQNYEPEYLQWKDQKNSQAGYQKQLNEFYQNHEATKRLNESKRVAVNLGEGVPAFNFVINNPDALTKMYVDGGETWAAITSNDKGEPDVQKQHLIGLIAHNPQKFMQDIFNYGVQMGRRKMVDEGNNAQRPNQKPMPQELNSTTYGVGKFNARDRD